MDDFGLSEKEIHLRQVQFSSRFNEIPRLREILSTEEKNRADRFFFEKDRQRSIIARAYLRIFLGRYLRVDPKILNFDYNAQGKPLLKGESTPPLQFNLSHSGDLAVYGFCRGAAIGVDLEYLGREVDEESIARNHFTPEESATILKEEADDRRMLFYRFWTLKESYIKAKGGGLSIPLDQFQFSLDPIHLTHLKPLPESEGHAPWSFHQWSPLENYVAALAVEGEKFSYLVKE